MVVGPPVENKKSIVAIVSFASSRRRNYIENISKFTTAIAYIEGLVALGSSLDGRKYIMWEVKVM
jgi:hypothetical protein